MVVGYPSGSVGSTWSFFTITPKIIFWRWGSVIPSLLPQLFIVTALSIVSVCFKNPLVFVIDEDQIGPGLLASASFLLAFLLVFKTMNAVSEFNQAVSHVYTIQSVSRDVARAACVCQVMSKRDEAGMLLLTKILRYLVMYFQAITEYFQRTGENATQDDERQDLLRAAVRNLAMPEELKLLYPKDDTVEKFSGSRSAHKSTNPRMLLFWLELTIECFAKHHGSAPLSTNYMLGPIRQLALKFWEMNLIDKTQFPLPYAQVLKILLVVYIFACPMFLAPICGWATPFVTIILTIGHCGLDEVAQILDSPFGCDANDIDLVKYGEKLAHDLDELWEWAAESKPHRDIISKREEVLVEEMPDKSLSYARMKTFDASFQKSYSEILGRSYSGTFRSAESDECDVDDDSDQKPQKNFGAGVLAAKSAAGILSRKVSVRQKDAGDVANEPDCNAILPLHRTETAQETLDNMFSSSQAREGRGEGREQAAREGTDADQSLPNSAGAE